MDQLSTYLFTQGALGVAVLVLGFVVTKLYKKTDTLEKEKVVIMEARRIDAIETTKQVIGVLHDSSQNIAILSEKIATGKQSTQRRG